MVNGENKVDLSILKKLWDAPGAADQTPEQHQEETKEPEKEEPGNAPGAADAPRNIFSLSEEQERYIARTKAEIMEQLYTADDTTSLFLKALGVMCVCLNDKAYYNQVTRLLKNVWRQGLGKVQTLEELPGEFILTELTGYMDLLKGSLKENKLDAQARADHETALKKMEARGNRIYKTLPETSKASFLSFGETDAPKRP